MLTPEALTLDQARSLEAGAETDLLVLLMIGGIREAVTTLGIVGKLPNGHEVWPKPCDCEFGDGWSSCEHWSPSTDANAAIEAAGSEWMIIRAGEVFRATIGKMGGECHHADAPTFPLAICRAIAVRYVYERDSKLTPGVDHATIDGGGKQDA